MSNMNYDQHVRVYRFVQNHEYYHMLWTYIDLCRREAETHRKAMTDVEYNLVQDYIINNVVLKDYSDE